MHFREATIADIPAIQNVRHSVKENVLSDPSLVTDEHCADYISRRGKGWVCEVAGKVVGFAIADLDGHNIWALFLEPAFENRGIGKTLHNLMLDWYFSQQKETVWLSTEPASRAAGFYRVMGWQEAGTYGKAEIKFQMDYQRWQSLRSEQKS
jgi:GNAT superfamily N-acetyltransferase